MTATTTVSLSAEQRAIQARIEAEVAELRASGCSREVYELICREHPEDAQAIAYRLSGTEGAR
jgi:hypothetical protein